MAGAALGLSILSLLAAFFSIGWQVYTWRRNAGRVTVRLEREERNTYTGNRDFALVTLRNVGSGPVYVQSVSFQALPPPSEPIVWYPEQSTDDPQPGLPRPLASGEALVLRYRLTHHGQAGKPI